MSHLDMDAATLAKLSRLLDEALKLEPVARAFWVESLGSSFDALKPKLRDLLARAATVKAGEFLDTTTTRALDIGFSAHHPGTARAHAPAAQLPATGPTHNTDGQSKVGG